MTVAATLALNRFSTFSIVDIDNELYSVKLVNERCFEGEAWFEGGKCLPRSNNLGPIEGIASITSRRWIVTPSRGHNRAPIKGIVANGVNEIQIA